jgi:adenylate cyclase
MADEIELKLALPPLQRSRLLRHPLLKQGVLLKRQRVVNIYYDTPDQALHREGMALRLRQQGEQMLQTVKCAGVSSGGLSTRPEWEVPYSGRFDFSCVTDRNVRQFLQAPEHYRRLQPCFETTFQRSTWRFEVSPGKAVLMMLDRGHILAKGRKETISEVELELDGADEDHLFALALALAERISLVPALLSKAERGYRLAAGTELQPVRAEPLELDGSQTLRSAFVAIALNCLEQLLHNQDGAVTSDDPEFIHQMRVALRRLHAALRLFASLLPPEVEALDAPLKKTMDVLGQVRNLDVLVEELVQPHLDGQGSTASEEASASATASLGPLLQQLEKQRTLARDAARAWLLSPEYGGFLLRGQQALHDWAKSADKKEDRLEDHARRQLVRLRKRVERRAAAARPEDAAALHGVRIAVKRLRYSLEFFSALLKKKTRRPWKVFLARHQELLGKLQDLAVAEDELARLAKSSTTFATAYRHLAENWGERRGQYQARVVKDLKRLAELPELALRKGR